MNTELNLANTSGFPLQLAVESTVAAGTSRNGWRVSTHEHPWLHGGNSGFADIVLEHGSEGIVRMVLECKKRSGELLFFRSSAEPTKTERCRVRWGYRWPRKAFEGGWVDVNVGPTSAESEFCVVNGEGAEKRRAMLETIAHDIVQAVEGICKEELVLSEEQLKGSALVYVPVIVTTAKLLVCHMDPATVDLKTGHLGAAEFEAVPYLRFRKTLTINDVDLGACSTLGEARSNNEKTVLVITADNLTDFLDHWQITQRGAPDLPWVALRNRIDHEDRQRWMREQLEERT